MSAFLLWPLAVLELTPRALAYLARTSARLPFTRPTTTKENTTA